MTLTMSTSSEKGATVDTAYIVTAPANENSVGGRGGVSKRHVLFAVSAVLVVGLVMTGILVGMHIFAQQQKDIVQFTLQFKGSNNEQVNQDVVSDPNDNVVQYHVTKPGLDVYVVNDFNKDLQIVKVVREDGTNCYVAPLNRTTAMDPSSITGPPPSTNQNGGASGGGQTYLVSNTPIADRSFLTKKASDMCNGVSLYWAYRHCGGQNTDGQQTNSNITATNDRQKRTLYYVSSYYGLPGLNGCCYSIWACSVTIYEYVDAYGGHLCDNYMTTGTCCGIVAYPYCANWYYSYTGTPGLYCP